MRSSTVVAVLALIAALIAGASSVEAQTCTGRASFSTGPVMLGARFGSTSPDAQAASEGRSPIAGVEVALGAYRGFFLAATWSLVLYNHTTRFVRLGFATEQHDDTGALVTSIGGGYIIPTRPGKGLEMCPIGGISRQSGPGLQFVCRPPQQAPSQWPRVPCTAEQIAAFRCYAQSGREGEACSGEVKEEAGAMWLGASVGTRREAGWGTVIPFVAGTYVRSRVAVSRPDRDESAADQYLSLTAGVGFVFGDLRVRPIVAFPLGLDGGRRSHGLDFALNIG